MNASVRAMWVAHPTQFRLARIAASLGLALVLPLLVPGGGFARAQERLGVVTTTMDLKSLAETVGGDRVVVTSLVPPGADPEEYQPRPQDLSRLAAARLVVRVGLDYDLWLDRLIARSGRRDLARRQAGHVDASLGITLLDVHAGGIGPGDGHAHGSGNPHFWLDPKSAELITAHILERLADLDPPNAKLYEANRLAFLQRLESKLTEWEAALAALRGRPIVVYHNTWSYFARRFRLDVAGVIEPRPGVPPGPAQLATLIRMMRERGVRTIVREPREPEKGVSFLAAKTGAHVALLAGSVGAVPAASDYIALFDHNVQALLAAANVP